MIPWNLISGKYLLEREKLVKENAWKLDANWLWWLRTYINFKEVRSNTLAYPNLCNCYLRCWNFCEGRYVLFGHCLLDLVVIKPSWKSATSHNVGFVRRQRGAQTCWWPCCDRYTSGTPTFGLMYSIRYVVKHLHGSTFYLVRVQLNATPFTRCYRS